MSTARDPDAGQVTHGPGEADAAKAVRLRHEIHATRGKLDRYLEELRRRRRELLDVRLQIRRHPAIAVGLGVAAAAAVGGAILNARRTRRRRALSRVRRALGALAFAASPPPPENRGGSRLASLFMDAGIPLGVALARGLLRRRAERRPDR